MCRSLVFYALLLLVGAASAQPADSLSDSASASLLTILPGDEVYSQFGHSGYRIRDPASGLDKTYNYGTFDFEQPFFLFRFVRGQLDYLLDTAPYELELDKYAFLRRPMIEQHLALPAETVQSLYGLLETNALPENRAYRYDFFFDNCSTRLLDILDSALVSSSHGRLTLPEDASSDTFRQLVHPYITDTPLLRLGINLGLGLPTDQHASARERVFLPVELMNQFNVAFFDGRRLVAATDTVVVIPDYVGERGAFDFPKLVLWFVLLAGLAATIWGFARGRRSTAIGRRGDSLLFTITGIAGLILAMLWLGTEHAVTGPNLNLLWAWPAHLLAAWWLWKPSLPRWMRAYLGATAITALAVVLFWRILPQALPAPILPIVLLLVLRSSVRLYARKPASR
ncbi:MAG: DUF4105 domain-containing protein [Bacteroidetes bacterium]|nr:DUF4105 domain-containing protein [Bacteroidota bacterium]